MGKHTFKGFVTSWDQIHQPVTILMDHNLRKFQKSGSRTLEADEAVPASAFKAGSLTLPYKLRTI